MSEIPIATQAFLIMSASGILFRAMITRVKKRCDDVLPPETDHVIEVAQLLCKELKCLFLKQLMNRLPKLPAS